MNAATRTFELDLAATTDQGLVRSSNQDAALVDADLGLAIVADGMGGHADGDVASALAVEELRRAFAELGGAVDDPEVLCERVTGAFEAANRRVHEHPSARDPRRGMGTTLIAAAFAAEHVVIAHVGDSRCYLWRKGRLSALTEDHSYAAMMSRFGDDTGPAPVVTGRWKHMLLKAVGREAAVEAEVRTLEHQHDDVYLLCSDGLWGTVEDDVIAAAIAGADGAAEMCKALVGAAWAGGGLDNIGIAAVRIVPNRLMAADPDAIGARRRPLDEPPTPSAAQCGSMTTAVP
jgi:PPM family protein phosphatase